MDEIRLREAQQIKDNEEVAANDAHNEALRQQRLEEAAMPIGLGEAPDTPILPSPPSLARVEASEHQQRHIPRAHSQSTKKVDPNREYKIQRAALGDNPTKEEMDAVVAYGLEQHRKNFPQLYL